MTSPSVPSRRRLGYSLFGGAFDYILHLRPAEWPIMAAHTALGTLLAGGLGAATLSQALPPVGGQVLLGLITWVILLNGGTLAINSAFDRDEGDIAYLRAPPPPPRRLFAFGLGLMLAGLIISFMLPRGFTIAYAICFVMSVLYSVPPARLKAVAGADWLINMWGFGTITPFAGWAATGRPLDPVAALVFLGFCPLFAALYPLTQIYQMEEDRARGDRTLVLRMGLRPSLLAAIACAVLAFGLFTAAGARSGWSPGEPWRWAPLGVAFGAWLGVLLPWYRHADRWSTSQHQRGMYLGLGAWAVTDVGILVSLTFPAVH